MELWENSNEFFFVVSFLRISFSSTLPLQARLLAGHSLEPFLNACNKSGWRPKPWEVMPLKQRWRLSRNIVWESLDNMIHDLSLKTILQTELNFQGLLECISLCSMHFLHLFYHTYYTFLFYLYKCISVWGSISQDSDFNLHWKKVKLWCFGHIRFGIKLKLTQPGTRVGWRWWVCVAWAKGFSLSNATIIRWRVFDKAWLLDHRHQKAQEDAMGSFFFPLIRSGRWSNLISTTYAQQAG